MGWISYIKQASLIAAFLLYIGPACFAFHIAFVMPTATASGAMDMGLVEFIIFVLDFYLGDFWSLALSWMMFGVIFARLLAEVAYNAFEPEDYIPETREESRRRVRANMQYSDDYFD